MLIYRLLCGRCRIRRGALKYFGEKKGERVPPHTPQILPLFNSVLRGSYLFFYTRNAGIFSLNFSGWKTDYKSVKLPVPCAKYAFKHSVRRSDADAQINYANQLSDYMYV